MVLRFRFRAPGRAALALVLLATPACGARSGLPIDGSSSTGTGPSTTSSSGSGGSTPKVCFGLIMSGAPIHTTDSQTGNPPNEMRARLVQAENGQVAVVLGEQSTVEGPPKPGEIRTAGLLPWSSTWPDTLGATNAVATNVSPDFVTTHTYGDGKSGYEVALVPQSVPGPAVFASDSLHTSQSYGPLPPGVTVAAPMGAQPLFLASTSVGRIVADDAPTANPSQHLLVSHVLNPMQPTSILACGDRLVGGAAAAVPNGALLAFGNQKAELGCSSIATAPSQLVLARWSGGTASSLAGALDTGLPLQQIEMVPRSDGAWVVWQTESATGDSAPAPVHAIRIDTSGKIVTGTLVVVPPGISANPFAAGVIGDELVVAYVASIVPNAGPNIGLRVFESDGTADGGADIDINMAETIPNGPWWLDPARLALLGDASSLVVGWSEHVTEPGSSDRVAVARFTCAGPE